MAIKLMFWTSAALVVYTYVGYPALLCIAQLLFRRPVRKAEIEPSLSLLIAAYNEVDVVQAKVRNSLALDYPVDKLEIVIASDGSTDATARIVRSLIESEGRGQVRLLEFPVNRGKIHCLNDAVPLLDGEIVVFSDASSMLARDSVRNLVANFADPGVGASGGLAGERCSRDQAAIHGGRSPDSGRHRAYAGPLTLAVGGRLSQPRRDAS